MSLARSSYNSSSGAIRKRRGKTSPELSMDTLSRRAIIDLIDTLSTEMVSCNRCLDKGFDCKVDKALSQRYSKCLRTGKSYDVVELSVDSVYRLLRDRASTKTKLAAAKSKLNRHFQATAEAKAEVDRLKR